MRNLLSVAEALRRVLEHAVPLSAEEIELSHAAGRVLAYPLKARRTQPPADVSAMDGYAVRSADVARVPVKLKLVGHINQGRTGEGQIGQLALVGIAQAAQCQEKFDW